MLRDIGEIQTLATKYSKPQLARMAQMGLIDPTKAVMAGMMIDRITKSNMQAPQQTVAEEALTPAAPPPPMQQAQPPVAPAGIGSLPTQPEPNAGVAALPSGITEMAGGGIVAFDEGGKVERYAEQGLVVPSVFNTTMAAPTSSLETDQTFRLMSEASERDAAAVAQRKAEYGQRLDAIRQKMAANTPLTPQEATLARYNNLTPASAPAEAAPPPPGTRLTNPNYVEPPDAAPRPDPRARPGARQDPGTRQGPAVPRPTAEKPSGMESLLAQRVPELKLDPNVGKFETVQYKMPEKKELKDYLRQQEEAERAAGVNTNIYKDLMGDLETKKGKLANRKQEAIGAALMQTGLGLLGARRGQEFAVLGEAGQRSLQGLVAANERIRETEEKIDDARRGLLVAENDYKRTRSDKALDRVERNTEKIENLEIKNIDNTNAANQERAKLGVLTQGQNIQLQSNRIQEEGNIRQAATTLEAERMRGQTTLAAERMRAATANRPSERQRVNAEYNQILKTQGPEAAEKYMQLQERIGGGGGKSSNVSLQEQYADDWNSMDLSKRRNYKDQGITTEQQYIDYRLRLAGRPATAQPRASGSVDANNPLLK
jgi:hypothetical protein